MKGILNIYKEKGYTSFDVIARLRGILREKKIGHAGTLDPDAEGVLPVCVGKATKVIEYLTEYKKEYKAVIKLGITTTTQDATGDILKKKEVNVTREDIKNIVTEFNGIIKQTPPMYSAIKHNGTRLYKLAREGKKVKRKERTVEIHSIEITKFISNTEFEILVECSKGTYIRTLCKDIGEKLGCGAHMKSLVRTKVGDFKIKDSHKLEEVEKKKEKLLIKIEDVLSEYPKIKFGEEYNKLLYNGNKIKLKEKTKESYMYRVYDHRNVFIGLYKVIKRNETLYLKPVKMFEETRS